MTATEAINWHQDIFDVLRTQDISLIAHVPDAGHTPLITLSPLGGIAHNAAIHVVAPDGRLVGIYDLADIESVAAFVRNQLDRPT